MENKSKLFFCFILILQIISCKKESKKDLISSDYFAVATNLKTLKNYKEINVNDSVKRIYGNFSHYKIDGFIDKNKNKISWWNIIDNEQGKQTNIKIEYKTIQNREIVNQFLFYTKNEGIYKINSKFYEKSISERNDSIVYKYIFYTPSLEQKIHSEAKFNYIVTSRGKEIMHKNIICKKNKNNYYINVTVPNSKNQLLVKGIFWELYQGNNDNISKNEIFVEDTIKPRLL